MDYKNFDGFLGTFFCGQPVCYITMYMCKMIHYFILCSCGLKFVA